MKTTRIPYILLFLFYSLPALAQKDTIFWFAAPEVLQNGASNFDRPIFLRLSSFATAATVTISQPAGGGMPTQVVSIPANSSALINLSTWINVIENQPANTVLNYGLKIQSTTAIIAYYHVESDAFCYCNPEIFTLKGKQALGTDFWIPGQDYWDNGTRYSTMPANSFDIVATQNGTVVTITPSNAIVGYAGGSTFTVNLNKGQTYSATATSYIGSNHLQGSRVTSNNPIAITIKDDLVYYAGPSGDGLDLIGDQIVPTNYLGTEYIAMNGGLYGPPGDKIFVTATQSGTTLSQNGSFVTTLAAGQTYQLSIAGTSTYIQTSLPAYVYQVTGLGFEISSALLPPLSCTGSQEVSVMQSSTLQLYLNLLVKNGGQGNFLLNGLSGIISSGAFSSVPGTSGAWYSAQIPLSTTTYGYGTTLNIKNTTDLFQAGMLTGFPTGKGTSYGYFADYIPQDTVRNTFDTTLCIFSSSANLAVPLGYNTYLWNTGATTSSIFVTSAGTYWCKGISTCGLLLDTFNVSLAPPDTAFFAVDTSICVLADSLVLSSPGGYDSYGWNTGSIKPSLTVFNSGMFWVLATDKANCKIIKTTFKVRFSRSDTLFKRSDTSLCATSAPLAVSAPEGYTNYLWNTGTAGKVNMISASGVFWVKATDVPGCSVLSDTIHVIFKPGPVVTLRGDTAICSGEQITLSSIQTADVFYQWNTGSTTSSIVISKKGVYFLTVTMNGCTGSDTVNVTELAKPASIFIGPDTVLCQGETLELRTNITSTTWSTGHIGDNITITAEGYYWAMVSNICGSVADSIKVDYDLCDIWFPSAFTPNGDGKNDIIRVVGNLKHYTDFSFSVFNRWGQRVFFTQDIYSGWNGVFNGTVQDLGTYFYMIYYNFRGIKHMMKGDFQLIR